MRIYLFAFIAFIMSASCNKIDNTSQKKFESRILMFLDAEKCVIEENEQKIFTLKIINSHVSYDIISDKEIVDVVALEFYELISKSNNVLAYDSEFLIEITTDNGKKSASKYRISELSILLSGARIIDTCLILLNKGNTPGDELMYSKSECIYIKEKVIRTNLNFQEIETYSVIRIEDADVNLCNNNLVMKLYKIEVDSEREFLWIYFDPISKKIFAIVDPQE